MPKSIFLQAFEGTNDRVPVWFMRQAGRYLPEYRALKEKHSLNELFKSPELAAEITVQPINLIGVDAAILFADILTLPQAMGTDIFFDDKKGPIIDVKTALEKIHDMDDIPHIRETIQLVNEQLPDNIPLIGFAGSPFTVLTYIIEGGSSVNFKNTIKFIQQKPEIYHELMNKLTVNTIEYFRLQKEAGIKAFQLFDTWAGILRAQDYAHYVLPYIQQIFEAIDIPSIYFARSSDYLLPFMNKVEADFLSVDHTVVIGHHKTLDRTQKGIQGNLYNGLLYADQETLAKEVDDVLMGGRKHDRFIFNLSHGIFPDVKPDQLKFIVQRVQQFKWQ